MRIGQGSSAGRIDPGYRDAADSTCRPFLDPIVHGVGNKYIVGSIHKDTDREIQLVAGRALPMTAGYRHAGSSARRPFLDALIVYIGYKQISMTIEKDIRGLIQLVGRSASPIAARHRHPRRGAGCPSLHP